VFIFEGYYYENETRVIENGERVEYYLPLDNSYVIENADGTYSIYLDTEEMPDYYLETLTSLEHYTQGIPVYYLEKYNYK
jgi:hypothetical protein